MIDFDTLLAILGRETLNCKETFVFNAADNWARAECHRYVRTFFGNYVQIIISHINSVKITLQRLERILLLNDFFFHEIYRQNLDANDPFKRRSVLGDGLNKIRFPAMSITDFADVVATSGMLTLQETNGILI